VATTLAATWEARARQLEVRSSEVHEEIGITSPCMGSRCISSLLNCTGVIGRLGLWGYEGRAIQLTAPATSSHACSRAVCHQHHAGLLAGAHCHSCCHLTTALRPYPIPAYLVKHDEYNLAIGQPRHLTLFCLVSYIMQIHLLHVACWPLCYNVCNVVSCFLPVTFGVLQAR
jgi:hypothetical protein